MNPVFSIGIYIIMQLTLLLLALWCHHGNTRVPDGKIWHVLRRAGLLLYPVCAALPVAGALLPDCSVKFALQAAGNIWIGFMLYAGGIFLIFCIILALLSLIFRLKKGRLHLGVFVCSLFCGVVILLYGLIHAQHTIVTEYDVPIEKSAGDLKELKLVLIGDLHLSVNTWYPTIEKIVDMINREEPDSVVVAGDIFTSSYGGLKNPEKYAEALRKIKTKYGVFAVYGNHDVEETLFGGFPISPVSQAFRTEQMERFFEDAHFTVLYDETTLIADGVVQLTGRIDGEKAGDGTADRMTPEEVLEGTDRSKPVIVLQHEPVEFKALKEAGADLALCGHTHAGQMFPGNLIVPFFNENAYGYKIIEGLDTIVTSGTGYYGPPMRVGTNSEITVLNLRFT